MVRRGGCRGASSGLSTARPPARYSPHIDPAPSITRAPNARLSLALLLSINLLNYIDRYNLSAVEEQIRAQFFKPDDPSAKTWMGMLATAFLVTYMVAAPIFGWLADRTRRWAIIGIGVLLWSIATGVCGLATSFTMLLVCRVFVGVGEAAWGPTAPTVISDLYPVSRRGAVMAWFNIALSVGSALGFIIGGQMAATRWGWPSAFLVVAPPGIILGAWALFMRDPGRGMSDGVDRRAADPPARFRDRLRDLATLVRIRSYVFNNLGMTAMTFAVGGMSFWMPTYVHEFRMRGEILTQAGRDEHAHINFVFGVITVIAGLAGTLAGGYLADWLNKRLKGGGAYFLLSGLSMLGAFPLFLAMLYTPFPGAWGFMAAAILLIFMNTGPTNTIIANVVPARIRASAFAINILVIHTLGDAISPTIIGAISDRTHSMNAGFAVVGLMMLAAGVLWLMGARGLKRDMERAVEPAAPGATATA